MSDAPGDLRPLLARVAAGQRLSEAEAEAAFEIIMSGNATASQIGGLLLAMRVRGETVDEITGAARIMRSKAVMIKAPPGTVDTCGTGGDGSGTFNVSTATALILAGAGVPVAKHGNRALSSRAGSADVLTALGVNIQANLAQQRRALDEANVCFLFAPAHHGAMRHVLPIRQELGFRTIFNTLGALSNPAGAQRQVLGAFSPRWVEPLARVLGALGVERAWVVHGEGLDEMTTTGVTEVAEWRDGGVRLFSVTPEAVGLPRATLADLAGGDPLSNADAIRRLLAGKTGPYRDIVLLNAAAGLLVGEKVETLREGVELAAQALDDGAAHLALERLVEATNRP
jgi:anthranilate phosphoribosyltransferase